MAKCPVGFIAYTFDATNPKAVAWATEHAGLAVTEVTDESKQAIRDLVVDAFETGIAPDDLATLIRGVVGLTSRDAMAVMNYQSSLMADGTDGDVAAKKAESYAGELHRARAMTIARTETMNAANHGQALLWEQAQEDGLLGERAMKVWIVTDDEATCEDCLIYEDETCAVDDEFPDGDPPLHPNCRCTMGLTTD